MLSQTLLAAASAPCLSPVRPSYTAPSTARTDIAPALPDGRIDMIPDLVNVIDAFRGLPYPFEASEPCPGG